MKCEEYNQIEIACGAVSNRIFVDLAEVEKNRTQSEFYQGMFRYSTYSKYTNGAVYTDYVWIDIDRTDDLPKAFADTAYLLKRLESNYEIDISILRVYFSGSKGFHIGIPSELFNLEPSAELPLVIKHLALDIAGDIGIDEKIYEKRRLWRVPNSINAKSGLYKIELDPGPDILIGDLDSILNMAKNPRATIPHPEMGDWVGKLAHLVKKIPEPPTEHTTTEADHTPLKQNSICRAELQKALAEAVVGNRNNRGFELACQLRDNGIYIDTARQIMAEYQVGTPASEHPYTHREAMDSVDSAYKGTPRDPSYNEPMKKKLVADNQKVARGELVDTHKSAIQNILGNHDITTDNGKKSAFNAAESYIKTVTNTIISGGLMDYVNNSLNITEADRVIEATFKCAADLEKMELPEIRWIVPGYIPEGLTLLAGRPKMGKSWLALGLAVAVANGGKAFGNIDLSQHAGKVLYLALEDNNRRMKLRLSKLCIGHKFPQNLYYATEIKKGDEGIKIIRTWLEKNQEDARLVVIDTLVSFRKKASGNVVSEYERDSTDIEPLQRLAGDFGIGILLIHHLRKAVAEDDFDTISGTLGLTGKTDSNYILKRARGEADAILIGTGRDFEDYIEVALKFDSSIASWILLGSAEDYMRSKERQDILDFLKGSSEPLSPKEIAVETGKNINTVQTLLKKLTKEGLIYNMAYGKYLYKKV